MSSTFSDYCIHSKVLRSGVTEWKLSRKVPSFTLFGRVLSYKWEEQLTTRNYQDVETWYETLNIGADFS